MVDKASLVDYAAHGVPLPLFSLSYGLGMCIPWRAYDRAGASLNFGAFSLTDNRLASLELGVFPPRLSALLYVTQQKVRAPR
jgi:hypothetical protein